MKAAPLVLLLALAIPVFPQIKPNPCPDKAEMQDEIKDTQALVARMQNRIITMRNAAGTVRDFEVRNALQVNADEWQDLLDSMKKRLDRLQTIVDRCEAREKIEGSKQK
jgi:predicted  nucleic acid-binding Zn-ribbon protein